MSTTARDCPACGLEDSLEIQLNHDIQGDGVWSAPVSWLEIIDQSCDCDLTEEQEDAVLAGIDPMDMERSDL